MAQSLIACPLCSAASFSTTSTLCLSLVSVASKWLRCTLCEEELHGLDKFTIHLLGHLIQTNNFKKHLTTDHSESPDMKQISHTEPLNLVKTHTSLLKETMNEITPPNIVLNESLSFQSKESSDAECERPSLKIDDEVMIFFNCGDQSVQNNSSDKMEGPEKICKTSHSPALSNLVVEFDQSVDKNSSNISTTKDITTTVLNGEYLTLPFTNDVPHQLFSTNLNPGFYPECSNNTVDNTIEMDLSPLAKQKESENEFEVNKNSDTLSNKPNEYDALQKVTGNRSSFLSPRGERVLGYRCDVCSLVFPDEQILLMHRKLIHAELSGDPTKEKKYKCHLCSKSFIMKGSLMVHMRVAHFGGAVVARLVEAKQLESNAVSPDSAQYVCSICNKGFTKEQQLTQHEKLHEGKQCDICLKTFTTKYFLRKHKRLHTGEMPYSCSVCNKSFTFQQSYHKHLLYHSDDKPYSCGDCGRAFKELSTLHNHQRIHTGEKPFSCETCGMLTLLLC
uniref:C2H2-type domain-containing protein n=1 Tax=Cuerna arida TaxID=1464854 RepID=A0A1B6GV31_9HEMI